MLAEYSEGRECSEIVTHSESVECSEILAHSDSVGRVPRDIDAF